MAPWNRDEDNNSVYEMTEEEKNPDYCYTHDTICPPEED